MSELDELAAKVRGLSPPDRLILAAELMRAGRLRLALTIAGEVVDRLRFSDGLCGVSLDEMRDHEKAAQS